MRFIYSSSQLHLSLYILQDSRLTLPKNLAFFFPKNGGSTWLLDSAANVSQHHIFPHYPHVLRSGVQGGGGRMWGLNQSILSHSCTVLAKYYLWRCLCSLKGSSIFWSSHCAIHSPQTALFINCNSPIPISLSVVECNYFVFIAIL